MKSRDRDRARIVYPAILTVRLLGNCVHVAHLGKGLKHATYLLGKTAVQQWSVLGTSVRLLVVVCAGLLDRPSITVDL